MQGTVLGLTCQTVPNVQFHQSHSISLSQSLKVNELKVNIKECKEASLCDFLKELW